MNTWKGTFVLGEFRQSGKNIFKDTLQ